MSKKPHTSIDINKITTALLDDDDDDDVPLVFRRTRGVPSMLNDAGRMEDFEEDYGEEEPISGTGDIYSSGSEMAEPSDYMPLFLTDPECLDCPICFLPLSSPVYQCTNGHVSCESCCTKMSNKCGTCGLPIGGIRCRAVERILKSFRIPCKNAHHGCKRSLTYIKKLDHEKTCRYAPCYCPVLNCTYVGLPKCVYTHFASQHYHQTLRFNTLIHISLGKDQKHIFLKEAGESEIFVVNRSLDNLGSIVNVICIAPSSSKKQFSYVLTAFDSVTKSEIILKSAVQNSPQLTEQTPTTNYVIVPNYCLTSSGRLNLEITIKD